MKQIYLVGFCCLLGLTGIGLPDPMAESMAKPLINNKQQAGMVAGRHRAPGGYGGCSAVQHPLTALVPYEVVSRVVEGYGSYPVTYVGGETTSANPTLWFYVPYDLDQDLTAEFIVQDDQGNQVHKQTTADLVPSGIDNIVSISVPIEVGTTYHWYFTMNCGSELSMRVDGGIKRISPDPAFTEQLRMLSPLEQIEFYRQHNLEYDAITVLGNLRREQPTDPAITAQWSKLLDSVGITNSPSN